MPIDFRLNQPGASFEEGFGIANRMLTLAADKQAGKSLAAGDRAGASKAYAERGFVPQAEQVTTRGLANDQVQASTEASQAATAKTNQDIGQQGDKEKLDFTMRAANTLHDTLKRDGPQAVVPAFDMIAPLIKTRGVPDDQIAQIRAGLEKDPLGFIEGLKKTVTDKLSVLSLGAIAVDPVTGEEKASNPMVYNPNVNVGQDSRIVNTQTGATVAEGKAKPTEAWDLLTPEQAKARGFRDGVQVKAQRDPNGGPGYVDFQTVDKPSDAATTAAAKAGQPPKLSTTDSKALETIRENNRKARAEATNAEEFIRINRKYSQQGGETGGMMSMPYAKEMVGAFDTDVGRMNTISERMIPKMREAGSGTTSDRDASRFERATVSTSQKLEVNELTNSAVQAYANRVSDYGDFMEAYALRNGSLLGAQGKWDRYIADPRNDVLNDQGRAVKPDYTWRQYMKWNEEQAPAAAAPSEKVINYSWTPEKGLQRE